MTLKITSSGKEDYLINNKFEKSIGKPYSQQPGRKHGKGAGHIKVGDKVGIKQDKNLGSGVVREIHNDSTATVDWYKEDMSTREPIEKLSNIGVQHADKPEPGKIYSLTGGHGQPSIASGNTWKESEVKISEIKQLVKKLHEDDNVSNLKNLPEHSTPTTERLVKLGVLDSETFGAFRMDTEEGRNACDYYDELDHLPESMRQYGTKDLLKKPESDYNKKMDEVLANVKEDYDLNDQDMKELKIKLGIKE